MKCHSTVCFAHNAWRGGILKLKSLKVPRSAQISIFGGGEGGILKLHFRIGVICRIWTKISTTPAGSCITDSLSHTTYVETNESTQSCEFNKDKEHIHYSTAQLCTELSQYLQLSIVPWRFEGTISY